MNGILLLNGKLSVNKKTDENGLIIRGLAFGDITRQNQELIIGAQKGEFKENPLLGVGVSDYLNGEDSSGLKVEIKKQLKADGQVVSYVGFDSNELVVDADYE